MDKALVRHKPNFPKQATKGQFFQDPVTGIVFALLDRWVVINGAPEGKVYRDTVLGVTFVSDGRTWVNPLIARLIPPRGGRAWTLHVVNLVSSQRDKVYALFNTPVVKDAIPFLGGDDKGWISVELAAKDLLKVRNAAGQIFHLLGVPYQEVAEDQEGLPIKELEEIGYL